MKWTLKNMTLTQKIRKNRKWTRKNIILTRKNRKNTKFSEGNGLPRLIRF